MLTRHGPAAAFTAASPQRREPETASDGSFTGRFHPLRTDRSAPGRQVQDAHQTRTSGSWRPRLSAPQRREPETAFDGSFVRRQFHPLRTTGPRSGRQVHGMLTRHEPAAARADRGLSARSGASRRRRLTVRSCAVNSTRCGPEVRKAGSWGSPGTNQFIGRMLTQRRAGDLTVCGRQFHPLRTGGLRSKAGLGVTRHAAAVMDCGLSARSGASDGSFVRHQFHPLRTGGPRSGRQFQGKLTRHEPAAARADRGLSARSGASRRRRLTVRSCAANSTRCGPQARAPEGSGLLHLTRFRPRSGEFGTCPLPRRAAERVYAPGRLIDRLPNLRAARLRVDPAPERPRRCRRPIPSPRGR